MKKSDLEVPVAPFQGENLTHDALLFWPKSHNWLNDNNNNFLNEGGSEREDAEEGNLREREDDAAAKELGSGGRANENNNAKRKAKATTSAESEQGSPASSSSSVIQLSVTKSSVQEPFGIIIQGGIDAPYIGENGEESTRMRIKEVRPGGAAARQRQLCSGMEIRRVNHVAVQGKTHQEIVGLIRAAGTHLDLDLVIVKSNGRQLESPSSGADHESDEEYADAAANFSENNDATAVSAQIAPILHDDAADTASSAVLSSQIAPIITHDHEDDDDDDHASAIAMATLNAAIISSCAAANAQNAAAHAARVEAASLAIDAQLEQLRRLRDTSASADDLSATAAAPAATAVAFDGPTTPTVRAALEARTPNSTVSKEKPADKLLHPQPEATPPSISTPLSNLLWGAVATHVRDPPAPEEYSPPPASSSRRSKASHGASAHVCTPSLKSTSESKTPSPYRIPTPSPLPPPIEDDDDDRAPNSPHRQRRADTPYPICFPRLPSALEADPRETLGGAASAMPPDVDVAQTLKEVVEARPFERPMTAWSIHDPTEEEGEGGGVRGRRGGGGKGVSSRRRLSSDSDASSMYFSTDNSVASAFIASGVTPRVGVEAAPRIDPHSEAAECKWRPTSGPASAAAALPTIRVTKPHRRSRRASTSSSFSSRDTAAAAAVEPAAVRQRRGEDGVYLLVGSLTLLAASTMVALYAAKHYKKKA